MGFDLDSVLEKKRDILINQLNSGVNNFKLSNIELAISELEEVLLFDDRNERACLYLAKCYSIHFLFGEFCEDNFIQYLEKRASIIGYYDEEYFKFYIDLEMQSILDLKIEDELKTLKMLEKVFIKKLNDFCLKFNFQYHQRDLDHKIIERNCETILKVSNYISILLNNFIKEKFNEIPYNFDFTFKEKIDKVLHMCKYELSFCYIKYSDHYFYKEKNYSESIFWAEKAISLNSYNRFYHNLVISYTKVGNKEKAIENYIIELGRGRREELFLDIVEKFGTDNLITDIIKEINYYSLEAIWRRIDWIFSDCINLHKKNFNFAKENLIELYDLYYNTGKQLGYPVNLEDYKEFKRISEIN